MVALLKHGFFNIAYLILSLNVGNTHGASESFYNDPKSVRVKPGVCDGYDGILEIKNGDMYATSGMEVFLYVVNQLIYAERNNLIPWVHFTQTTSAVYDKDVHNAPYTNSTGKPVALKTLIGIKLNEINGEGMYECRNRNDDIMHYPGSLDIDNSDLREIDFGIDTSGVWDMYFEPVSGLYPKRMTAADRASCATKPIVALWRVMQYGVHICAPWAVRAWVYPRVPTALQPNRAEPNAFQTWFKPMREAGHRIVTRYINPLNWLINRVNIFNPYRGEDAPPCLAMHIHLDVEGGQLRPIKVNEFLPYAEIFAANGGEIIYVATDFQEFIEEMKKEWPDTVLSLLRFQYKKYDPNLPNHNKNIEELTDIYAMARCGFIVHGFSAISEAAIYINGNLHDYSVNLEDPEHVDEAQFEEMVKSRIGVSQKDAVEV